MEGIRNARLDPISTKHVQIISIPSKTENDEICAGGAGAPSVSKNARLLNTIDVLSAQTKRGVNVALRELFDRKPDLFLCENYNWMNPNNTVPGAGETPKFAPGLGRHTDSNRKRYCLV